MLAQIEPTRNGFLALARYLVHGDERPTSPERVAWVLARNLPTDDPELAARYMEATAALSRRCLKPTYHVSINWAPGEDPAPELMQEIALRTLELSGLGAHEALIMGHGDTAHRHLHMMINRVHPDTGRAWSASQDYRRFDRIMKRLAEAHGFRHVPCHNLDLDLTDADPQLPDRKARRAAARGAPTSRIRGSRAAARRLGTSLSESIDRATGWEDIEAALVEHGLSLEAKGKGLVAGNAEGYFKFSHLGLSVTAKGLAGRFGRPFKAKPPARRATPRQRPTPVRRALLGVDAVDIARAIGTKENVRSAVQEAIGRRKARLAKAPLMTQMLAELKEQWQARTSMSPARARARSPAGKPRKSAARGGR